MQIPIHTSLYFFMFVFALMTSPHVARAQAPHEVVLIVNTNSTSSVRVAEFYARERQIPASNVIHVGVPQELVHRMPGRDFSVSIWEPVRHQIKIRGLDDHILAWVYSCGFPVSVGPPTDLSLTGITFARNVRPTEEQIKSAAAFSPLFAGPARKDGARGPSASLVHYKKALRDNYPIPAMMLGYTGPGGNTEEEVIHALQQGIKADHTMPFQAPLMLINNTDIRWTCREWQLDEVLPELKELGLSVRVQGRIPPRTPALLGVFTGEQHFPMDTVPGFVPGAIGDHLTSFAGHFEQKAQMNLGAWIRAGAAGATGTVTEPYAIWAKFPHLRTYAHYARGCTLLESFYQSLLFPHQLILIGDPLCRPFAPPITYEVVRKKTPTGWTGSLENVTWIGPMSVRVLLDGKPFGRLHGTENFPLPPPDAGKTSVLVIADGPLAHYGIRQIGNSSESRD